MSATPRGPLVQNSTADPELAHLASQALAEQLKAHGMAVDRFELDVRLEATAEGGLRLQILCSTRADHLLRAHVQVKGQGPHRKLIASMVKQAARDLVAECR